MKNKIGILVCLIAMLYIALASFSCKKDNTGRVTLYTTPDLGVCDVKVYVDNVYKGTITQSYNKQPACNSAGCVTFSATDGTHNMRVAFKYCDNGDLDEATGTVKVSAGKCIVQGF